MASSQQPTVGDLPFSPRIISTPTSQQVLTVKNLNTGSDVKSSLNFSTSNKPKVPGSLLNLTLNGVSGLINQNVTVPNPTEQPSFLGMLFGDTLQGASSNSESGLNITLNGLPGNISTQFNSNQQTLSTATTEYSKPRIVTAVPRDISLTMARLPAPAPVFGPCPCCKEGMPVCPCRKPKSNTGTQYEDDPFMSKTYSKDECMTPTTEAFREVSVSVFFNWLGLNKNHLIRENFQGRFFFQNFL